MRTIGLDVHKHFADVAILQPGAALQRQRITTDPEGLRARGEIRGGAASPNAPLFITGSTASGARIASGQFHP